MSELMDRAVIGMPYEMAMADELSRRQFYARAQALLAERDALNKDAERYRWLNNPANFHAAVSQQLWLLHGSQEFGERIDKAIGKGEQP